MALRLLLLSLFICYQAFAQTSSFTCHNLDASFKRAAKLKIDQIKDVSSCLEKLNKNKIGIKFHIQLIKSHFKSQKKKVLNAIYTESIDFPYVKKYKQSLMKYHLQRLTLFYLSIFEVSNNGTKINNQRKRKINWFIDTLANMQENEDDEEFLQDVEDRLLDKKEELIKYDFKQNYFLSLNFISWQNFHNSVFNTENIKLLSTNKSQVITVASRWRNIHHEFNIEFSYLLGSSNISPLENGIGPSQGGVGLNGVLLNFSYHTLKLTDEASFGIELPFLVQRSAFSESLNLTDEQDSLIASKNIRVFTGLVFGVHWDIKRFTLLTKIGKLLNTKSSFLQFGLGYNF